MEYEEAIVQENLAQHVVTGDHVTDHKMVEMNIPLDKNRVQNKSI